MLGSDPRITVILKVALVHKCWVFVFAACQVRLRFTPYMSPVLIGALERHSGKPLSSQTFTADFLDVLGCFPQTYIFLCTAVAIGQQLVTSLRTLCTRRQQFHLPST